MIIQPSEQLRELDQAYHLHPFTNHEEMHAAGTHIIRSAEGRFVIDQDGNRLLDGIAGLWCVNVGYGRHEIVEAVTRQMQELPYYCSFLNSTTQPPILLAERLARLAPARLNHTTFTCSGSEANETALKIIRGYYKLQGQSQKYKILSRTYAYHGVTLATTSMTGLPACYGPFDLPLPGFLQVPGPYHYGANTDLDPVAYGQWCVEETARIIEREGADTIAALFAEPIQGAGGVIVPPEGYLPALRQLCWDHNILFVADEVITGFGRLGDWFASTIWDLDPDLMTMAKGITSGYLPLGATMVSDEVAEVLIRNGYFAHGFTYSGHPTSAAAALANLDILEGEGILPWVRDQIGPYFQRQLKALAEHPAVGEARGDGLIGALEVLPRGGKAALNPKDPMGVKLSVLAREEGVIVRGIRDLIALSPPLTITETEVDFLFTSLRKALDRLW
ncbi:aspartate aminotransferase family protein [Leptolyngbya sp. FACHB-261]|uniref:aminotransferase family protein n=1 Tax=Leptolyngbya sp. FACHB-261 TaxID=2692806 RepID=UPI00168988DB|nr:aminotransferase [Leptolyngbya sp. FACHB-261]MBD2101885.1 aminotransferase class III-fold pyridoxal phosphate-dependent enzyme [Leptolyngbya sp. FACHB-261]